MKERGDSRCKPSTKTSASSAVWTRAKTLVRVMRSRSSFVRFRSLAAICEGKSRT